VTGSFLFQEGKATVSFLFQQGKATVSFPSQKGGNHCCGWAYPNYTALSSRAPGARPDCKHKANTAV
jgi:hypothetical protein